MLLNALKQKRAIILTLAGLIIVGICVWVYFMMNPPHQSSNNDRPATSGSPEKKGANAQGQTPQEATKDKDDTSNAKEQKSPTSNQPSATNDGSSQTGGSSGSTSTGGGGGAATGSNSGGSSGSPPSQSELFGWRLTSQNTGLAPHGLSCGSLPLYAGSDKPASGTVISQKRIATPLDLSNGNITIEKSCIQPPSVGLGLPTVTTTNYNVCNPDCEVTPSSVTIRDSEFDGSHLSQQESAYSIGFLGVGSLYRNYIHGFGSGIGIANAGLSINVNIEGNYVTGLTAYGDPGTTGNHSDAFTIRDFITTSNPNRQAIVKNNRFNSSSGNDTGAFFIQQTWGDDIDNVLIEGNLLEGLGYQLQLDGNTYGSHLYVVNNRFSGTGFGAAAMGGSGVGWGSWTNNFINNPSASNNQGAVVPKP